MCLITKNINLSNSKVVFVFTFTASCYATLIQLEKQLITFCCGRNNYFRRELF